MDNFCPVSTPGWPMGKGTTCYSSPQPSVILEIFSGPIGRTCPLSWATMATITGLHGPSLLPCPLLAAGAFTHSQRYQVILLLGTTRWLSLFLPTHVELQCFLPQVLCTFSSHSLKPALLSIYPLNKHILVSSVQAPGDPALDSELTPVVGEGVRSDTIHWSK